ncbi:hypothetical protein IKG38_01715 [Candidatus Saccharibacteria bacterium]|nr:hypothetical protein [Candidatus Saccharibacteria bacterium]
MKIGLFILYGILVFFITLTECFLLNGGISVEKDSEGFRRLNLKGEVGFYDWARSFILAIIAGFMAGLAPTSGVWGIVAFVVALAMMGYICFWSATEASEIKEMVCFAFLMLVIHFISNTGAIASGAVIRNFGFVKFLKAVPGMALVACIAIMVASNLLYRSRGGNLLEPDKLEKQKQLNFKYAAYAVIAIAAVIVIVMFIKSIT